MKNNKNKFNITIMISFFGGLVIYLIGLFLLFGAFIAVGQYTIWRRNSNIGNFWNW